MKKSVAEIVGTIVNELTPLASEERLRVIQASMTLLGEAPIGSRNVAAAANEQSGETEDVGSLPTRARTWIKQNQLSPEQLEEVFHIGSEGVDVIASEIPGKNNKEKVRNAYVLLGIARLLGSGEPKFDDKAARALCESSGFYDHTNHMKYMKGGNEFTGTKDKGWTLTGPGLKRGAVLVMELSKGS
jgi:predicted XRE-type DNA-binding protein